MTELEQKAHNLDETDPLKSFRQQFIFPKDKQGHNCIYLCGNSLGLQPSNCQSHIERELNNWSHYGVEGHFKSTTPWFSYHQSVRASLANIHGAYPHEVVAMNSLTTNLHLLMVSFYRPKATKRKIVIEAGAFPSDRYAVQSQLAFHGFDPKQDLIELTPTAGQHTLTTEQICQVISEQANDIALVLLSGVQYFSGQCFDMATISHHCHQHDIIIGFDLAHASGNIPMQLHDWQVDFAAWCSYKYLNSGPGGIGGLFVHQRHCQNDALPRFAGWWGNDPTNRFTMPHQFTPVASADAWQLSNPPIFQLAALKASMTIFDQTSITKLRKKSLTQTDFLIELIHRELAGQVAIITPLKADERGNQLSLKLSSPPQAIQKQLAELGVITDFRAPDVLRIAVAPLYTSYKELWQFVVKLKACL